jgi:hypothetical protein
MSEEELIKQIRAEIFSLAKGSSNMEVMHWYMWLDECFKSNELGDDEVDKVCLWIETLINKKEYVDYLLELLQDLLTFRQRIKGRKMDT